MNNDRVSEVAARIERGAKRAAEEQARIDEVRALGFVPSDVGPVPEAPARGPVKSTQRMSFYPDGEEGFARKPSGYMGRKTLERADVFDRILLQSARTKSQRPLTPSQIATGRAYRDLTERYDRAGVRCSSLETSGGGGTGGSFIDAVVRDGEQLRRWHHRIGDDVALVVRRVRPSQRGTKKGITDRTLVDMVCLGDKAISEVLKAHGWSVEARNTKVLLRALAAILDRMTGPVGCGIRTLHNGARPPSIFE